jgi:LuxR family maltose regulon positive regulatory protein
MAGCVPAGGCDVAKRKQKPQPQGSRDSDMLDMLVAGKNGKQIAKAMGLSHGTVRVYLHRMYKRLGVTDKTAAAVMWTKRQVAGTK